MADYSKIIWGKCRCRGHCVKHPPESVLFVVDGVQHLVWVPICQRAIGCWVSFESTILSGSKILSEAIGRDIAHKSCIQSYFYHYIDPVRRGWIKRNFEEFELVNRFLAARGRNTAYVDMTSLRECFPPSTCTLCGRQDGPFVVEGGAVICTESDCYAQTMQAKREAERRALHELRRQRERERVALLQSKYRETKSERELISLQQQLLRKMNAANSSRRVATARKV